MENAIHAASISEVISTYTRISTFPLFFIQHKKPPFSFCVFILTNEKEGKNQILALNIKFMPYYNKTYTAS